MTRKGNINRSVCEAEVGLSPMSSSVCMIHSLTIIILLHFCQNGAIDEWVQTNAGVEQQHQHHTKP